jgi:hypothetical protein
VSTKPISASHLSLWKRCQRREAFTYRQDRREAAGGSAEAGKRVHAVLEAYYRHEPVDWNATWGKYPIGRLAENMSCILPANDNADIVGVEQEFTTDIDGITFHGIKDLVTVDCVFDHKTTSAAKYIKSVAELEDDVQRLIYTESEPAAITAQWTSGVWSNLTVHPKVVRIDRRADRERFKLSVLRHAEEMLSYPPDVDPLSLPPTLSECKFFPPKGCPFQADCFPQDTSMLRAISETLRPDPTPPAPTHLIDMLFIDCMPLRELDSPAVSSWELLAKANRTVADDRGVHSALLVDYGKGPAMIACEVKALLEESPVKYLLWESRSTEGRACLTTLVPLARIVIKGVY